MTLFEKFGKDQNFKIVGFSAECQNSFITLHGSAMVWFPRIRTRIGNAIVVDSGSRRAKMTHKIRKKWIKIFGALDVLFWGLRAASVAWLRRSLRISKLQFLSSKPWIRILIRIHLKSWIRIPIQWIRIHNAGQWPGMRIRNQEQRKISTFCDGKIWNGSTLIRGKKLDPDLHSALKLLRIHSTDDTVN